MAAQAPEPSLNERGVEARLSGQLDTAETLLAQLVEREPGNADARLQLGLTYLARGRLDEAQRELEQVLTIAPDYADARIALARVAERRGWREQALSLLEPLGPDYSEAAEIRTRLRRSGAAYRSRVDFDFGASSVESQQDWREASLQLSHQATESTALTGRLEWARRFGLDDLYGELRLDQRLSPGFSLWTSAGATPNADFRPRWQVAAGVAGRLRAGPHATIFTLDGSHARYRSGEIQTLNPGIEQYLPGGRAWATVRWINIFDENGDHHSGWLARSDVLASDRLRLFVGAADAPDVSEGVVTETFSLFGGLVVDLSGRIQLRVSAGHEDRPSGGRLSGAIGLGWRF